MAQRQFRSDDTSIWLEKYGTGKDGVLTISGDTGFAPANESCSGTSGNTTLTLGSAGSFENGDYIIIHQTRGTGVGNWELNRIVSGAGTTTLTLAYALMNTYTDSGASQAQVQEMPQYSGVTVNTGVTLSAPAWDGNKGGILAFFCNELTSIIGTISANSKGYRGGVNASSSEANAQGEGTVADRNTLATGANGNGGGGGRHNSSLSGGGGGGHSASGSNGVTNMGGTVGTGGGTGGGASLVNAIFGGAGGSGTAGGTSGTILRGGNGGLGGGFILIISKNLTVTGSIVSNGGVGGNGVAGGGGSDYGGGGGGGGAGGSILLKGVRLDIGSNLMLASSGNGGNGSTGGGQTSGGGGNGSVGRIHADYASALVGSTNNPTIDSTLDTTIFDDGAQPVMFVF